MRCGAFGLGLLAVVSASIEARADHAPSVVMPSRPDVPIVIGGYDARWAVVEGEWGLSRPGHMPVTVIGPYGPAPRYYHPGYYYPSMGERPRYGRQEVETPESRRQRAAQPYRREWGAASNPAIPATEYAPFASPPVIVAPTFGGGHHQRWRP